MSSGDLSLNASVVASVTADVENRNILLLNFTNSKNIKTMKKVDQD